VRVTLTDGTELTVDDPTMRNDSITGVTEDRRVQIGVSDVSTVEVWQIDVMKNFSVIVVASALFFVGVLMYCNATSCQSRIRR
jgi:hypothetical protein